MSDVRRSIRQVVLEDGDTRISILNIGCAVRDWRLSYQGEDVPMVLGFSDPEAYHDNPNYLGVIAGRVANRIDHGRFVLAERTYKLDCNLPPHHIHGGRVGLSRRVWQIDLDRNARTVQLRYHSPDGEDGYPGAVDFEVTMRLDGHRLSYAMRARPDRPTPISLAQHSYYNLLGAGTCRGHRVFTDATELTPLDETQLPTGEITPVDGTRYDHRTASTFDELDRDRQGTDINFMLRSDRAANEPAAVVEADNGLRLRLWTDQPALQLYDATHMGPTEGGLDGRRYDRFAGLCLEPQAPANALNMPQFGSIICTPEAPYSQDLTIEIAPGQDG